MRKRMPTNEEVIHALNANPLLFYHMIGDKSVSGFQIIIPGCMPIYVTWRGTPERLMLAIEPLREIQ